MLFGNLSVADLSTWLHFDSVRHILGDQSVFVNWLSRKYLINE